MSDTNIKIIEMLKDECTYDHICKVLKVSKSTIAKVKKSIPIINQEDEQEFINTVHKTHQKKLVPEAFETTAKFDIAKRPLQWIPSNILRDLEVIITSVETQYKNKKANGIKACIENVKEWIAK